MEIKETAEKNVKFARASFREAKRGANFVKTNLSSLNMGNDKKRRRMERKESRENRSYRKIS